MFWPPWQMLVGLLMSSLKDFLLETPACLHGLVSETSAGRWQYCHLYWRPSLKRNLWLGCTDTSLPGWRAVGRTSGIPSTTLVGPPQHPVALPGGRTVAQELWPCPFPEQVEVLQLGLRWPWRSSPVPSFSFLVQLQQHPPCHLQAPLPSQEGRSPWSIIKKIRMTCLIRLNGYGY